MGIRHIAHIISDLRLVVKSEWSRKSMIKETQQFIGFKLDDTQHALPLACITRVIRVVDITLLPNGPAHLLGVINLQGNIIPVLNIREVFHFPQREVDLADLMIIFQVQPQKSLALIVNDVMDIINLTSDELSAQETNDQYPQKTAISKQHGLMFIHDPLHFQHYSEGFDEQLPL